MAAKKRMIASLDKDGVLIGRVVDPTDAQWEAAAPHCRFPNGFDNALNRYALVQWRPGRWRFEPLFHKKERAAENHDGDLQMSVGELASMVWAITAGVEMTKAQKKRLALFVASHDNIGFVPRGEQRAALKAFVSDDDGGL